MVRSIIIAEDDERLRNALKLRIRNTLSRTTILETDTGSGLVKLVKEHMFSLFVLADNDLKDGIGTGLAALKEIRKVNSIPMYLTSQGSLDATEVLLAGGTGYIPKPYSLKAIAAIARLYKPLH